MKVLYTGLFKTGTTSFNKAFKQLGFKTRAGLKQTPQSCLEQVFKTSDKLPSLNRYDGFTNGPWLFMYREIDEMFPGSKFILTIRDEEEWWDSMYNFFPKVQSWFHQLLTGAESVKEDGAKEKYLAFYRKHNADVQEYFKDRDNLLVLGFEKDFKWRLLCDFLQIKIPKQSFPHLNKSKHTGERGKSKFNNVWFKEKIDKAERRSNGRCKTK